MFHCWLKVILFDQTLHAILILLSLENEIKASEKCYKKTEDYILGEKEKKKKKEKPNLFSSF